MILTLTQQSMKLHNREVDHWGKERGGKSWLPSLSKLIRWSGSSSLLQPKPLVIHTLCSYLWIRSSSLFVATFTFACCRSKRHGRQELAYRYECCWFVSWDVMKRNLIRRDLLFLDSKINRIMGFPYSSWSVTYCLLVWQEMPRTEKPRSVRLSTATVSRPLGGLNGYIFVNASVGQRHLEFSVEGSYWLEKCRVEVWWMSWVKKQLFFRNLAYRTGTDSTHESSK
jgi:hypothetical protein